MHAQLVNELWSSLRKLGLKEEANYIDFLQLDVIRRLRGKERLTADGPRLKGRSAGGSALHYALARTRRGDVEALTELLERLRTQAHEQGYSHKEEFLQEALGLIAAAREKHEAQEREKKREHAVTLTQEELTLLKTALQFYERHDRITHERYLLLRDRLTPEKVSV